MMINAPPTGPISQLEDRKCYFVGKALQPTDHQQLHILKMFEHLAAALDNVDAGSVWFPFGAVAAKLMACSELT
jgi:hypothetical protein